MGSVPAAVGWALAAAAVAAGWLAAGWGGVLLAVTVTVFWLLLQFSRALRALRTAAQRPVGSIDNAVMVHARVRRGQRLAQLLVSTRSLGHKLSGAPETYVWRDDAGDAVQVTLVDGVVSAWTLQRADAPAAAAAAASPPAASPLA